LFKQFSPRVLLEQEHETKPKVVFNIVSRLWPFRYELASDMIVKVFFELLLSIKLKDVCPFDDIIEIGSKI
jgi:hypothetical protein